MAENVSQDLTHMQLPHGRLSWIKLPINGGSLEPWEVTDATRGQGEAETVPEEKEA